LTMETGIQPMRHHPGTVVEELNDESQQRSLMTLV
jgi:hypothetical protein